MNKDIWKNHSVAQKYCRGCILTNLSICHDNMINAASEQRQASLDNPTLYSLGKSQGSLHMYQQGAGFPLTPTHSHSPIPMRPLDATDVLVLQTQTTPFAITRVICRLHPTYMHYGFDLVGFYLAQKCNGKHRKGHKLQKS